MSARWNRPQFDFKIGDRVLHLTHGIGNIVDEWGTFTCCRKCAKIIEDPRVPCCNDMTPHQVSGHGTFEILFNGERIARSINQVWLTPKPMTRQDRDGEPLL